MLNGISSEPNMQMRQLANELVNATFWMPMLKGFRESQSSGLLGNGPGSTTFVQQLDRELITRISQRGSSSLADSLLRQLGGQGVQAAQLNQQQIQTTQANQNSASESVKQGNENG